MAPRSVLNERKWKTRRYISQSVFWHIELWSVCKQVLFYQFVANQGRAELRSGSGELYSVPERSEGQNFGMVSSEKNPFRCGADRWRPSESQPLGRGF